MLVEVEAEMIMVLVLEDFKALKHLRCVVSGVHCILVGTRVGVELAPIDRYGNKSERAVRVKGEAAVLPLHYSLWAFWVGRIGDSAIVCFFVETVCCEGVGDAGVIWLDEPLVDRVIESGPGECFVRLRRPSSHKIGWRS